MRVTLINPPYQTLTSQLGVGHQVPLGLLMVGGPLIDTGHDVSLLDAEALHLPAAAVAEQVASHRPDVVMIGHAGSTPAHNVCVNVLRAVRAACPHVVTVYGGVYPTYHDAAILETEPCIDIVVRGEGEAAAVMLLDCLSHGESPEAVGSITYRTGGNVVRNANLSPIRNLDDYRVGWELIDNWDRYQCFGLGRAAIIQFSRGCPHRCTYCGQHGFWKMWRSHDPVKLADEIAWLHDEHGVRFITLADENPTTDPRRWRRFLEELAKRDRDVKFFATIRAADIVRDEEFIDLYRLAGILYILMGIDAVEPQRIERIRKRSTTSVDARACRLLREAGIRSMIGHIVGLGEESIGSFFRAWRALVAYDGDLLNVMYATPHSWTAFAEESSLRPVVQEDLRAWDYRHQVLGEPRMSPWKLFAAVKILELAYHLRPRQVWRMLFAHDAMLRRQRMWTALHIGAVWIGEIAEFARKLHFAKQPRSLSDWFHKMQGADSTMRPKVALMIEGKGISAAGSDTLPDHCHTRITPRVRSRPFHHP